MSEALSGNTAKMSEAKDVTNQSLPDHTGLVERPNLHNADEIAAFLSEWLTVGDGSLRGVPFVAVLIAEAADSLSTRVKELEEECGRWRNSFAGHVYVKDEDFEALCRAADVNGGAGFVRTVNRERIGAIKENATLRSENERLTSRAKAAEKALVSLTPDGSEFYCREGDGFRVDVLACMAYIRRRRDDQHKTICNAIRERKAAEASLQQMRKALEPFAEFAGASGFGMLPDDMPMTQGSRFARRQVTAGDFKQARAALSTITEDKP